MIYCCGVTNANFPSQQTNLKKSQDNTSTTITARKNNKALLVCSVKQRDSNRFTKNVDM